MEDKVIQYNKCFVWLVYCLYGYWTAYLRCAFVYRYVRWIDFLCSYDLTLLFDKQFY